MFGIEYHHTETSDQEVILLRTGETTRHYPWHIHANHFTVGMVISGTATLGMRETRHALHRGQLFSVRPLETHSLTIAPETVLIVFCVDIQKMDKDELPKLDAMIRGLKTSICEEGIAQPQLVERCHMLVSQETERHDWIGETTDPFQQVTRLLLAKPRKTLSIEQMAALTGYSQWHFLRRFRQQTGMTPHAFQLACRLRSARSFLRKNVPIAEAAVSAGFSDQSHMHKVFKNHNGLTPRQFQQVSFRLAQK